MGKGKSGHKENNAAKKNRARYQLFDRREVNKARKAKKEEKRQQKLLLKGKGVYAKTVVTDDDKRPAVDNGEVQ